MRSYCIRTNLYLLYVSFFPTARSHESWIISNYTGTRIKQRFSASEYTFGSAEDNTTFNVYVYNFTPPIEIVVSFSQHPKLDLVQFFSIFSL